MWSFLFTFFDGDRFSFFGGNCPLCEQRVKSLFTSLGSSRSGDTAEHSGSSYFDISSTHTHNNQKLTLYAVLVCIRSPAAVKKQWAQLVNGKTFSMRFSGLIHSSLALWSFVKFTKTFKSITRSIKNYTRAGAETHRSERHWTVLAGKGSIWIAPWTKLLYLFFSMFFFFLFFIGNKCFVEEEK